MTDTETTITEINKKLEELKIQRVYIQNIDDVLRWIEERAKGLSSANEIKVRMEFRRKHTSTDYRQYNCTVYLPPELHKIMLMLTRDSQGSLIPPLEAWLDERNIEHIESAKAD